MTDIINYVITYAYGSVRSSDGSKTKVVIENFRQEASEKVDY